MMNYKTLVAASLMSIALTSAASAQCLDCAQYPDRDVLNHGAPTPASKMGSTAGTNTANSENSADNARVNAKGMRHRNYRDASASIAEGSAPPAGAAAHEVYIKSLHDSGYNPASDFDAAGNMKVN
jgi:hypothetical protein